MHISVKWFDGKYPSFNLNVSAAEGKEEFLSIKGCRIANGPNGEFLAMPSTKNESTGKYWHHAWVNEAFGNHVLDLAKKSQPGGSSKPSKKQDEDIPF